MHWLAPFAVVLLAGCVFPMDGEDAQGPSSVPDDTRSTTAPDMPGLRLSGTRESHGGAHSLSATARNEGSATYQVSSICFPVFVDQVHDASHKRVWPEPRAYCEAFGTKPFAPGASLSYRAWWNETREGGGKVGAGAYDWTVTFHAGKDETTSQRPALTLTFRVDVA